VVAVTAGPAGVLSFVLAGIASIFAALCYSEFASLVPMAGSAYTYGYATLGEIFAWIIGWDLVLEYALGAVTVAIGWSGYVVSFLHDVGLDVPCALSAARGTVVRCADGTSVTAVFNLPAVVIIALVTALLVVGIKESATTNNVIVFIKLAVVVLFIVFAAHAVNRANWHPFIPPGEGQGHFGWDGVVAGGGIVFFACSRFGAVATGWLGPSRVLWSMCRDGRWPHVSNRTHARSPAPSVTSIVTGIAVAFFAAILPLRDAASLVSIGTLLAFVIVSIGIIVLRVREPNLPRAFKTPAYWIVAPAGAFFALYLMIHLSRTTWERLIIWFVIGMFVYFGYGVRNSKLAERLQLRCAGSLRPEDGRALMLGVAAAALVAACKGRTRPHKPMPIRTYRGVLSAGDSL